VLISIKLKRATSSSSSSQYKREIVSLGNTGRHRQRDNLVKEDEEKQPKAPAGASCNCIKRPYRLRLSYLTLTCTRRVVGNFDHTHIEEEEEEEEEETIRTSGIFLFCLFDDIRNGAERSVGQEKVMM